MAKLEFDRPVLRSLFCGVSFEDSPLFPDVRGTITQQLLSVLRTSQWRFNSHELDVINEDAKRIVSIEPGMLTVIIGDPPADGERLRDEYVAIVSMVLNHLKISSLSDLAIHASWHLGARGQDSVPAWLHEYLGLEKANMFFDAFGGKPSGSEVKFRFEPQDDVSVSVTLKPIDADEAADDSFFDEDPKDFPDDAIELALWRFKDSDDGIPVDDLADIWIDGYSRVMRMSERACLAITGTS